MGFRVYKKGTLKNILVWQKRFKGIKPSIQKPQAVASEVDLDGVCLDNHFNSWNTLLKLN